MIEFVYAVQAVLVAVLLQALLTPQIRCAPWQEYDTVRHPVIPWARPFRRPASRLFDPFPQIRFYVSLSHALNLQQHSHVYVYDVFKLGVLGVI